MTDKNTKVIQAAARPSSVTRAMLAVLLAGVASAIWQAPALAQTCSCPPPAAGVAAGVAIRAEEAPPPLPDYDQPPMPAPGYLWTPGYWAWNNSDYYWVPGTWAEPPHPGLLWTPGYWGFADGAYLFHRGYWGEHVGFYGGVSYGFGYTGSGYEGGRWDNGHFFYNRVANNFGNEHVTNVYEKTIINNNQVNNRVSFNGGSGGVQARPTPAEEAAAREQHVPPTSTQVDHARSASMNGSLFHANNHGKPEIAATPRPAAFSGAGVARAREGGPATPAALQQGAGATPAGPHPGATPAAREPERNAVPGQPAPEHATQNQHEPAHNNTPAQIEPRPESHPPAAGETKHGPEAQHPQVTPHIEAPHAEKQEPARPAPHPEAHAAQHAAAAKPPASRPAKPQKPAPNAHEEHREEHR